MVHYRAGYRFQLAEPFQCATPITEACAGSEFVDRIKRSPTTLQ